MIGAWNGLAKRSGAEQDTKSGFEANAQPMRRTVAFAKDIKAYHEFADSDMSKVLTPDDLGFRDVKVTKQARLGVHVRWLCRWHHPEPYVLRGLPRPD